MAHPRALQIVATVLNLRQSHPRASASDVLDFATRGQNLQGLDFGQHACPPDPFALIVADAMADAMAPGEWSAMTGPRADPALASALLEIWRTEVWPRFIARSPASGTD